MSGSCHRGRKCENRILLTLMEERKLTREDICKFFKIIRERYSKGSEPMKRLDKQAAKLLAQCGTWDKQKDYGDKA